MTNHSEIAENYDSMIRLELESMQLQIKLINANQTGHFEINKIITKEARATINESRNRIKEFNELKNQIT